MSLDDYAHLWDGTETGWKLHHYDRKEWLVTFRFFSDGPTLEEIRKLRGLLDEFRDTPMSEVWKRLRGQASYALANTLSNLEMRRLTDNAKHLDLTVSVDPVDRSGYLPVYSDGSAMIIEEDVIAAEVARRMIEAGVEVQEVHVD